MPLDSQAAAFLKRQAQLGLRPVEQLTPEEAREQAERDAPALFGPVEQVASVSEFDAFVIFFGLTTYGLLHGLAQGSAVYGPADLAIGVVVWLVELAAVALLFRKEFSWYSTRKIAVSRSGTSPISPG